MQPAFIDRVDAGRRLAGRLAQYGWSEVVVLAIPRGGVPVGIEVARRLRCAFDVIVPRKITVPGNPEVGYGAVAEDGTRVLNEALVRQLGLADDQIDIQVREVRAEIARRSAAYRGNRGLPSVTDRTVVLVDDGLASGYTMAAAVKSVAHMGAAQKVSAVPVSSRSAQRLVEPMVDELIALIVSDSYPFAVASFYQHWYDLSEQEVLELLQRWQQRQRESP
jgi:predicted phosphoribosyltransferase